MLEIALNAKVLCVDGHAGKSTHVIFNATQRTVTHIVVKNDKRFVDEDHLVPVEHIAESTHDQIRLSLTLAEVKALASYSEVHYIYSGEDYYTYAADYVGIEGPY